MGLADGSTYDDSGGGGDDSEMNGLFLGIATAVLTFILGVNIGLKIYGNWEKNCYKEAYSCAYNVSIKLINRDKEIFLRETCPGKPDNIYVHDRYNLLGPSFSTLEDHLKKDIPPDKRNKERLRIGEIMR